MRRWRDVGRGAARGWIEYRRLLRDGFSAIVQSEDLSSRAYKAKDWEALRANTANPQMNRAISAFRRGHVYARDGACGDCAKASRTARYKWEAAFGYGNHFFRCHIAERGGTHGVIVSRIALKVLQLLLLPDGQRGGI
jgi:hypothetical protein